MTNAEVAAVFKKIALLLELKGGENPFKIRAYNKAYEFIENHPKQLQDIYEKGGVKSLQELPGIGIDLSLKMEELFTTQKLKYIKELEKSVPPGLIDMMDIEGMGPKKTKFVWEKYKVKDAKGLKKLAESGKLEKLKGWGEKSVQSILKGIELQKSMGGRLPIAEAQAIADELVSALKKSKLCTKIEVAGSLRRGRETIGDIDILVTSKQPSKVMDVFTKLPQVARVTAKGKTKSTIFLRAGLDADIRVVDDDVFGAALHYFTGSKAHNVHIRRIGIKKGRTISEYGVYKGTAKNKSDLLAARSEKDVYKAVGLPYIEPEIREDRGEIEAAKAGKLPNLVKNSDLKGDLHMHSDFSDGKSSIIEMAKAAKKAGLQYIAITDHASPMGMVKGLKKTNIKEFLRKIENARKKVPGIHILAGAEVDILEDGSLYLPDSCLKQLDWVIGAIHQHMKDSSAKNTTRVISALNNPYIRLLGHPTARILTKREGIQLNMDLVLTEAKKRGIAVELDASPGRLDLSDVHCRQAKEIGAKICINSDAHRDSGLNKEFGVKQARRGWLEKKDVLNTKSWSQFKKWLDR